MESISVIRGDFYVFLQFAGKLLLDVMWSPIAAKPTDA